MRYNIALLHKKVTSCITFIMRYSLWKVMHYDIFALLFIARFFIFRNKNPKSYIFGNYKRHQVI